MTHMPAGSVLLPAVAAAPGVVRLLVILLLGLLGLVIIGGSPASG